jgi:hypothetical protein
MAETMFRKATEASNARSNRDKKALIWTVKSLSDDAELEPFVEGISDVLWGTHRRRYVYDDHILGLMHDPDVQLFRRIRGLLNSCSSGLLGPEISKRRQISCYKALWALATIQNSTAYPYTLFVFPQGYLNYEQMDPEVIPYALSADVMQRWANYRAAQGLLKEMLGHLNTCSADLAADRIPNISLVHSCLRRVQSEYSIKFQSYTDVQDLTLATLSKESLLRVIKDLIGEIGGLSLSIFMNYLVRAWKYSNSIPYRFKTTQYLISPSTKVLLSTTLRDNLQFRLDQIIFKHGGFLHTNENHHWLDDVFSAMVSYWHPIQNEGRRPGLPWGVVKYLNTRTCVDALGTALFHSQRLRGNAYRKRFTQAQPYPRNSRAWFRIIRMTSWPNR